MKRQSRSLMKLFCFSEMAIPAYYMDFILQTFCCKMTVFVKIGEEYLQGPVIIDVAVVSVTDKSN